jgi:hypothetical protein
MSALTLKKKMHAEFIGSLDYREILLRFINHSEILLRFINHSDSETSMIQAKQEINTSTCRVQWSAPAGRRRPTLSKQATTQPINSDHEITNMDIAHRSCSPSPRHIMFTTDDIRTHLLGYPPSWIYGGTDWLSKATRPTKKFSWQNMRVRNISHGIITLKP